MGLSKFFFSLFLVQSLLPLLTPIFTTAENSNLFREYIGAQFRDVKFSDVPINPNVNFHFILAFAIDYTTSSPPSPTNGQFNIFWDSANLSPSDVSAIKAANSNVKVALSLGGDSVDSNPAYFKPSSVDSWVANAVSSLTSIIQEYNLDGVDVDYEHFQADSDTFAECIGQLLTTLKSTGVIKFASIAPFDDEDVQSHYKALWAKYSNVIDYVNFQFYAYDSSTTVSQYVNYYNTQSSNYNGGNILASFTTGNSSNVVSPDTAISACKSLKMDGKLFGIFIWSADDSKSQGFKYETQSQDLLADA
ncbi:chitinase 2-like [Typha latifolia]|uniref:chitinase 2-like n=1 Tax=Typha latifolia TaxID=4733 RepID=UPI003C3095DB